MENDRNKIREPFPPDHTPTPPDHSPDIEHRDPNLRNERNEKNAPMQGKSRQKNQPKNKVAGSTKRLGESETEITDETTI